MDPETRRQDPSSDKAILEIIDERPPNGGWAVWLCIAIIAVALVSGGTLIVFKILQVPEKVIGTAAGTIEKVFRPNVTIESAVYSTFENMKKDAKLIVFSSEITVIERRESDKRILWDKLSLGTTEVELRVPGNKVQYVVNTNLLSPNSVRWDKENDQIVVTIPNPVVDEEMVSVQTDPDKIEVRKEIGWGRLESHSGEYLERSIQKDLRSLVIREAKNELLLERARSNAEQIIRDMFRPFLEPEEEGVAPVLPLRVDYTN